jgi:hypothetical protein
MNDVDKLLSSARIVQQPQQMPLIAFGQGLAELVTAKVFTPKQVFDWVIYGRQPSEFSETKDGAFGHPFEDPYVEAP